VWRRDRDAESLEAESLGMGRVTSPDDERVGERCKLPQRGPGRTRQKTGFDAFGASVF